MEDTTDWRVQLFGSELVACEEPDKPVQTGSVLRDGQCNIVGVYFSFANINVESDEFTKHLMQWCAGRAPEQQIPIVQVVLWTLSDLIPNYEQSYRDSLRGLPWHAIPFNNVETKRKLSQRYRIKVGSPTFVLVEDNGVEVSRPDISLLSAQEEQFPWRPKKLVNVLENVLLHTVGEGCQTLSYREIPPEATRAFYFGAYWCPPCRVFTQQLKETYQVLRNKGKQLYIIYVSSDRSEESYGRGVEGMPWHSIAWADSEVRKQLTRTLCVEGIPSLRLIDPASCECYEIRQQVQCDPEGLNYPWFPSPLSLLTEYQFHRLRDHPAIILFVDGDKEEEVSFGRSVLRPAAESYYEEWSMRHPGSLFPFLLGPQQDTIDFHYSSTSTAKHKKALCGALDFVIGVETEVSDCLRDLCNLDDAVPLLTAVDFPRQRLCVMEIGQPLTTLSVQHFIDSCLAGLLPFTQLPAFPK